MVQIKWAKMAGSILIAAFFLGLLLTSIQSVAAAPDPVDTIPLDGSPNRLMPVDVAVNDETGLVYVVNQGAGHVWVISGTEYVTTIDPPGGGCPGWTGGGRCLNSVNVSPFTGKAYVTQWRTDHLQIISGTELIGSVYGGQGPASSVTHPYTDTIYALSKYRAATIFRGVTVIKGDDNKVGFPGFPLPETGCVNPINGYAYISNVLDDEVLVIDDSTLIAGIPIGSWPNGAACAADGHVYIVNSGSTLATVSVITGTQVITTIPVGQSITNLGVNDFWGIKPSGSTNIIVINEQTGYVYVSNWLSNTVSIIRNTVWITDVAVGGRPNSIGVYTPTNTIYVANVLSDNVSVISGTEVIATIPVGDYPIALDVNSDNGYVYVVNRDSDSVSIIQGIEVVATIGRLRPRALAAQGGRIYSANSNGTVSVVEGANLLATIAVGDDPQAIIGDDTYVYVANANSASISVISGSSSIMTLTVGANPRALTIYTPTNRVYVANAASNTVSVLNGLAVETTIAVGGGPGALATDPASGDIFVANTLSNTVTVINGVSQVGNVQVNNGPQAIAFNPANGYAYVANSLSATVSILDGTTLLATRPVSATPTAIAAHPETGYIYVAARDDDVVNVLQDTNVVATIQVGDQPNAIAVDRDLGFVYVTCEGDDRVWVLSGTISLDLDFTVGDQPVDVVIEPTSGEGYVANYGDASLSRIQNLPPTISSATPDRTEVGQGITTTLNGSGYFLTPTAWLNDTQIENVQRIDRTTLSGYVPDTLLAGEYTVTVRTADSLTGTQVGGFIVTQHEPTATVITPASFANHVTTTVRITGGGFISTPTSNVGDTVLQHVIWLSSEVITAQIPPGLTPGRYQTIFFDNMEQRPDHWSPDPVWQLTLADYHSANQAWSAGGGSSYGVLYLSLPLDLTTIQNPKLWFWERRSGSWDRYDHTFVELSTDGGASWNILGHFTTSTDWQRTVLDLSPYAAIPTATLRFRISGDKILGAWYIDDVHVGSMPDGLLVTNPGPGSSTGYLTAPFTVTNQADHFVFAPISSPQITGEPFTVTITAQDTFGYLAHDYVGTVMLSATAPISPANIGPFSGGVWSGLVQIDAVQTNVVITATDTLSEAISGSSASFDVSSPQAHHFVFDPISSPQMKGQPFTVTISAYDALSYLVQTYTGTVALSATASISPAIAGPFAGGIWSELVQIDAAQTNVVITATDKISTGISGSSMPFDVCALPEITSIGWIPTNPVANEVITFNVSVDPDAASPISYTWDFGDYRPLEGMCYGPYRAGQNPELGIHPSRDEIREDINILADFTNQIRIYTARDIAIDVIQLAAERGISVTLGAWIDVNDAENDMEIASLISLTNQYTNVTAVVVGNERLLFNSIPKYKLISYINQVQQAVNVPVSTAEPWSVWLDPANQDLVDAVDYLLVHIHPFWESVSSDNAVDDVAQKYNQVKTQYPGKPLIIGETGWPSAGSDVGDARPGLAEQHQFVEEFATWAANNDVRYFYFEAFDEPWKCNSPEGDVGCHWGLFTKERWPKPTVGPSLTTTSVIVTYTYKSGGDNTVRVEAENTCGYNTYSATLTIIVPHVSGVALSPNHTDSANPNSVVTYTHILTNTGNDPDTFDIAHHSSQGWIVAYDTPINAGYGQTATVVISVTVPAGVISGTVDTTVITATSQADTNVWASATDTTIIGGAQIYLPLILKNHR